MFFAAGEGAESNSNLEDNALAVAIARAWKWQEELEFWEYSTIEQLASAKKMAKKIDVSYVRQMFRLDSLASDIVEVIVEDRAPEGLSLTKLHRGIPLSWKA